MHFWLCWVFVAARAFLRLWRAGVTLVVVCGLPLAAASLAAERGLSSCGARPSLPHSMWDLPRPGMEPASPTLAGGSLTTGPPGKSTPVSFPSVL